MKSCYDNFFCRAGMSIVFLVALVAWAEHQAKHTFYDWVWHQSNDYSGLDQSVETTPQTREHIAVRGESIP